MTMLDSRRPRHRAGEPDTELATAGETIPGSVRIGGVSVMTRDRYAELQRAAREESGIRGRLAIRRLAAENRRRVLAIRRACEQGGFDVEGRTPGSLGATGAGGGRTNVVISTPEWRATTAQVAGGFWPHSVGATSPLLGTPLGSHLRTGQDFGCDPLSYFMAGLITAPIAAVLGLNGFGKSSLVRRLAIGNMAQGHTSMFLGDIKPDYANLTSANGGQVITGGYGYHQINPLSAGALGDALDRLPDGDLKTQVATDLRSRQVATVAGLIEINRGVSIEDFEETVLASALDVLYRPAAEGGGGFTGSRPPILGDLYRVVKDGNTTLMEDAAAASIEGYRAATADLCRSLRALVQGRLGQVLNGQTTVPIDIDAPAVCIDVSRVPKGDRKLKAALLLVCWADGFGAVEAAHVLADAGLAPRRTFQVIVDEMWNVIGSGAGIVDRVDSLIRVENRGNALSIIFITHSVADFSAFDSPAEAKKAVGFLEKAQLKFIGPCGPEEIERLGAVTNINAAERALITNAASTPPPSDSVLQKLRTRLRSGGGAATASVDRPRPHGQGVFVLKIGADDKPGIPFRLNFTPLEATGGVHNTNSRFAGVSARRGERSE